MPDVRLREVRESIRALTTRERTLVLALGRQVAERRDAEETQRELRRVRDELEALHAGAVVLEALIPPFA